MQLTRELIVNSALEILDAYGLSDMTMRRVAKQLSVAPGALYWHVANKQELIGAIAELILAPVAARDSSSAVEIRDYCRTLRDALLGHRDGAELVASALAQPGSTVREAVELRLTQLVEPLTSSPELGRTAARALLHLLLGACVQEQTYRQFEESVPGVSAASISDRTADIDGQVELILSGLAATSGGRP